MATLHLEIYNFHYLIWKNRLILLEYASPVCRSVLELQFLWFFGLLILSDSFRSVASPHHFMILSRTSISLLMFGEMIVAWCKMYWFLFTLFFLVRHQTRDLQYLRRDAFLVSERKAWWVLTIHAHGVHLRTLLTMILKWGQTNAASGAGMLEVLKHLVLDQATLCCAKTRRAQIVYQSHSIREFSEWVLDVAAQLYVPVICNILCRIHCHSWHPKKGMRVWGHYPHRKIRFPSFSRYLFAIPNQTSESVPADRLSMWSPYGLQVLRMLRTVFGKQRCSQGELGAGRSREEPHGVISCLRFNHSCNFFELIQLAFHLYLHCPDVQSICFYSTIQWSVAINHGMPRFWCEHWFSARSLNLFCPLGCNRNSVHADNSFNIIQYIFILIIYAITEHHSLLCCARRYVSLSRDLGRNRTRLCNVNKGSRHAMPGTVLGPPWRNVWRFALFSGEITENKR